VKLENIATLWRDWLNVFRAQDLQKAMLEHWPGDRNITERISYSYPPVFQPGYVGNRYGTGRRILFLGYNPGEGSSPSDVQADTTLSQRLAEFADGRLSFKEYSCFLSGQVFLWNIYRNMGIFRECGATRLSLIGENVRPSIETVALLNAFPFKTRKNYKAAPLVNGPLAKDMWNDFTMETLRILRPEIIVHYPKLPRVRRPELKVLCSNTIEVWHPSLNSSTRPVELSEKWKPVTDALFRLDS
jgi:hypothetical protein